MRIQLVAMVACLAGCTTTTPAASGDYMLKAIGDTYVGRPVTDMAARYGVPHEQKQFGGQRIYQWHANNQLQYRQPVSSTTQGTISGTTALDPSVRYRSRTTSDQVISTPVSCTLTAYANDRDEVVTVGMNGKLGACDLFNPFLSRYA